MSFKSLKKKEMRQNRGTEHRILGRLHHIISLSTEITKKIQDYKIQIENDIKSTCKKLSSNKINTAKRSRGNVNVNGRKNVKP
jgi:hypothetical protein